MKLFAAVFLLSVCAAAQNPAIQSHPDAPAITERQTEQLDLYDTKLKLIAADAQLQANAILERRSMVIQEMLKANPGWEWVEANSAKEHGHLVRRAPPVK